MSCWQQSNFHSFQAVCVIVALLSWLLMRYTGLNVQVAVEACTSGNTSDQSKFCEVCYLFKVLFNTNREVQSVTVMIFTFNSPPCRSNFKKYQIVCILISQLPSNKCLGKWNILVCMKIIFLVTSLKIQRNLRIIIFKNVK